MLAFTKKLTATGGFLLQACLPAQTLQVLQQVVAVCLSQLRAALGPLMAMPPARVVAADLHPLLAPPMTHHSLVALAESAATVW